MPDAVIVLSKLPGELQNHRVIGADEDGIDCSNNLKNYKLHYSNYQTDLFFDTKLSQAN